MFIHILSKEEDMIIGILISEGAKGELLINEFKTGFKWQLWAEANIKKGLFYFEKLIH